MKVSQLIALLQAEDPNAEVRIIDPENQGVEYNLKYYSQQNGVTQIPEKLVYLMPILPQHLGLMLGAM